VTGSALENERNSQVLAVEWKKSQEILEPVGCSEWGARSPPKVVICCKVAARRATVPVFIEETIGSRIVTVQVLGFESVVWLFVGDNERVCKQSLFCARTERCYWKRNRPT